jgi:transposase-like protein
MEQMVAAGTICLNEACDEYGQADRGNLVKLGTTRGGAQRYRCKTCGMTCVPTKGTVFYRRRTPHQDILESLALLAEGSRISSIARTKGVKADTVLTWLREAAAHAERVEDGLLQDYHLSRAQVDGLWTYVGRKREKGGRLTTTSGRASIGARP